MTRARRVVILIGLVVIAGLAMFPPWYARAKDHRDARLSNWSVGHHYIFARPHRHWVPPWVTGVCGYGIDQDRLLLEWLAVGAVTAGLVVALGARRKPQLSDKEG